MVDVKVDGHKLMYHPKRVGEWAEKGDCYPIYVEIGPTNVCNHNCIFCALDYLEHGTASIDTEVMLSALKEMGEQGVKSVMFAGEGEPLLHKDICLFIEMAKEFGMDVSITTNGVLFNREKAEKCLKHLSWIRFSVDASSGENYEKIHGTKKGDFDKVLENIKNAVEIKNASKLSVVIGVQFLLIPQNINEVVKLAETCKEIGADNLQVKPYSQHPSSINRLVLKYEDYSHLGEKLEKLNSDKFKIFFRKNAMKIVEAGADYKECFGLPFFALIDAWGNVIPCNLFYDEKDFVYGNLYEKTFSQIWESEQRKKVLEKLKEKGIRTCRYACRLDTINRYLERLKNPQMHDNFI